MGRIFKQIEHVVIPRVKQELMRQAPHECPFILLDDTVKIGTTLS